MRKIVAIENVMLDGFEFRILVHPLTLGRGTPLFDKSKLDLELLETKAFGSGAVYVRYQVL